MMAVRTQILCVGFLLCLGPGWRSASAQSGNSELNPFQPPKNGFGLYDITLFSQYYSQARPTFTLMSSQPMSLGFDVSSGVSGSLGWNHSGLRTSAGFTYSGSYGRRARYSEWNTNDHSLSLWLHRSLSHSWDLRVSANGSVKTLDQFLFQNEQLLSWATLPATFDDLAGSMLRGEYSNQQLASMLTGMPVVATPAQTLIYGNRFFQSGASATLSYAPSTRLRISWGAGAGRMQGLPSGSGDTRPLMNHSTRANADMGISYALTPRMELALTAAAGRQFSIISNQYNVRGLLSLSRALTRQWYASVEAGRGTYLAAGNSLTQPPAQSLGGVTLAHRSYSQTWMLSAHRSLADSYALGSRSTVVVDAAWSWSRPGSSWFLTGSGAEEYMDRSALNTLSSWRLSGGVGRHLGREMAIQTGYSFVNYRISGTPSLGLLPQATIHAVRMAFVWSPMRSN